MARAGRKRKQGKREANGRLKRVAMLFDKGTERTQAMQALYGQDGADAIGRAYRAGLLGEGSEAKALLDTARRIANAYWQAYATGTYNCPLGERTHGSVIELDHERIKRREQWLNQCLDYVRCLGPQTDRAFRNLVIDVNPDSGPDWLDTVIWHHRRDLEPDKAHLAKLMLAVGALESLAQ
jgi:hypothetical protein